MMTLQTKPVCAVGVVHTAWGDDALGRGAAVLLDACALKSFLVLGRGGRSCGL